MTLLSSSQWFLSLLAAAIGLTIASLLWRLPQIERIGGPASPAVEAGEAADAGA